MADIQRVVIGTCTLYCGDAHDVLPTLGAVDAVVTDPPYGTGWLRGGGKQAGVFRANGIQVQWDRWSTTWIPLVRATTFAVFCPCSKLVELLTVLNGGQLRVYINSNPRPGCQGLDAPSIEPIVIFPRIRFSTGGQHMIAYNGDSIYHPNQKPLSIMTWLLEGVSAIGETILDPFMGSGTTALACLERQRSFIGIEQDPEMWAIACRLIEQAYAQPVLFPVVGAKPLQQKLFAGRI